MLNHTTRRINDTLQMPLLTHLKKPKWPFRDAKLNDFNRPYKFYSKKASKITLFRLKNCIFAALYSKQKQF